MPIDFSQFAEVLYPQMTQQSDAGYQDWLQKYKVRESADYDTYGAYKAGLQPDERGHLNDEFKKDTHITYSTESRASKAPGAKPAGEWLEDKNGQWTFKAVETNVENAGGVENLKRYFDRAEPESILILPDGTKYIPGNRK